MSAAWTSEEWWTVTSTAALLDRKRAAKLARVFLDVLSKGRAIPRDVQPVEHLTIVAQVLDTRGDARLARWSRDLAQIVTRHALTWTDLDLSRLDDFCGEVKTRVTALWGAA